MGPEAKFYYSVRPKLIGLPRSYWFPRAAFTTIDLNGVIGGTAVALEFKRDVKAKRSLRQKHILDKIIRAGGYASFVYPENWAEIFAELRGLSLGGGTEDNT